MSSAILSRSMNLDQMEEVFVPMLSKMTNLNKPVPKYKPAFRPSDLGKLYKVKPLTDQSCLTIFFQIPDYNLDASHKFAPNDYYTSLIGHEGPESVLSELKAQGLGTSLLTKIDRLANGLEYFRWVQNCDAVCLINSHSVKRRMRNPSLISHC